MLALTPTLTLTLTLAITLAQAAAHLGGPPSSPQSVMPPSPRLPPREDGSPMTAPELEDLARGYQHEGKLLEANLTNPNPNPIPNPNPNPDPDPNPNPNPDLNPNPNP